MVALQAIYGGLTGLDFFRGTDFFPLLLFKRMLGMNMALYMLGKALPLSNPALFSFIIMATRQLQKHHSFNARVSAA